MSEENKSEDLNENESSEVVLDRDQRLALQDTELLTAIKDCIQECKQSEQTRKFKNDGNWRMYNGDIDWSGKAEGQARIHVNKAGLATDQITAQMKKGLMNFDKFLVVENRPGYEDPTGLITDTVAKRLIMGYLEGAQYQLKIGDSIKNGVIESRSTIKVTGKMEPVKKYYDLGAKTQEMKWCLYLDVLPYTDYHTDPYSDLYEYHETPVDYHKLYQESADIPTKTKKYRRDKLKLLNAEVRNVDKQDPKKADETLASASTTNRRKPITVVEFWGTVLDREGMVMEYELPDGSKISLDNITVTIANEKEVITYPKKNPRFSKTSPFITTNLIRVQGSRQPKAIIDAGVDLNRYMDELLSLAVDGARKAVHGVKQVRMAWLTNPEEVEGGVGPDTTLLLNELAPANADAMTTISTGEVPQEVFNVFGICGSSFAENVMQNEISLSGQLPAKAVKATEVSAAGSAISGIFESFAGDFELDYMERLVCEIWYEILQNADQVDDDLLSAAFSGHEMLMIAAKERPDLDPEKLKAVLIEEFKGLNKKKRFEYAADAFKFKGKGIRSIAASAQKMQQYMSLLSICGQNPQLMQEIGNEVSIPKLFKQLVKAAGIDVEEIALTPAEIERQHELQMIKEGIMQNLAAQNEQGAQGGQPQQPQDPTQGGAAVSADNASQTPPGVSTGNDGSMSQ